MQQIFEVVYKKLGDFMLKGLSLVFKASLPLGDSYVDS